MDERLWQPLTRVRCGKLSPQPVDVRFHCLRDSRFRGVEIGNGGGEILAGVAFPEGVVAPISRSYTAAPFAT